MIHLMKLELIKTKIKKPVRQSMIAILIVLALIIGLCFESIYGKDQENILLSFKETIIINSVLVRAVLLIFSSVLMNKLTIAEYRDRTILQLFTYPIQRKKIFATKLMIVFIYTTVAVAISCIFNNLVLYLVCNGCNFFQDTTIDTLIMDIPDCLFGAIMCGFISLVPFFFGMRKKSGASTIISSVIITVLLCNSMGSIDNNSYMIRLLIIGGISIILAFYTVCVKLNQMENSDL